MSTSLKQLAKRARNRLKTAGEYAIGQETTACLSASSSYITVANIRKIEDDPMFNKVKKILEKSRDELVINPLSYLIESKVYKKLSDNEREKYILKLTKKFNTIRDYIISNRLLESQQEELQS